ncbi:MAG TPA: PhzF family phenazine biosynthesis protein [Longimicrobium sp.]|nr:PhzF family phenazine biosynthesis protein [Longimicrobium sp.]
MRAKFHTLDVFTDRVFGGNPLAVFPDAGGIAPETMQRIARELNLSETVFVTGAEEASFTVRIFTPSMELPFAGHPTVGTAMLLAMLGRAPAGERVSRLVLREEVGPVPVEVRMEDGRPTFAMFAAPRVPEVGPPPPAPEVLAEILSIDPSDLGGSLPTANHSAGVPFLFVSVRTLDALGRARVDVGAWERHLRDAWAPHVYVTTDEVDEEGVALRARMFAPAMSITEDPATGAAATSLAGLLGARDAQADGTYCWKVVQGVEMGRPSRIMVEADVRDRRVVQVRVGGAAVHVIEGEMMIPEE